MQPPKHDVQMWCSPKSETLVSDFWFGLFHHLGYPFYRLVSEILSEELRRALVPKRRVAVAVVKESNRPCDRLTCLLDTINS